MGISAARRHRAVVAMTAIATVLSLSACGSSLSHQELLQANLEGFRAAQTLPAQDTNASGPEISATVGAAVGDTSSVAPDAGGSTVGPSGGPSATASAPSGSKPSAAGSTRLAPTAEQPKAAGSPAEGNVPVPAPAGGGGPTPSPRAAAKAEIRLGNFGTQSGPIGAAFLPIVHAAKAWTADVNARGGLAGHPVRLILGDDGGDPARALGLAKRMVEEDKIIAFYGCQGATTLQAVTPYMEQRQVPMIYNTPSNAAVDESPMVFNATMGAKLGTQWAHIAGLTKFSDRRKIALLFCREAATCSQVATGVEKLAPTIGADVVFKAQVSLAQPDFTAEVIAARNNGADVVIPVLDNASAVRIMRAAHRQGWHPVLSIQNGSHDERFIAIGGADVEGALIGSEVPWTASPKMAGYRDAVRRFVPGGVLASLGGAAWVGGKLLERIAPTFPPEPASKDVLAGLWALDGETLDGLLPPITFPRDGGHERTNPCVVAVRVENGKFVEDQGYSCPPR